MKKYAMVAINKKELDDGIHIRRVLVSYLFKTKKKVDGQEVTYYHGTKFIIADPYFTKKSATHKYTFNDRHYKLDKVEDDGSGIGFLYALKPELFKKRKYHNVGKLAFEFKAASKQAAVHRFKVRKELR